MDKNQLKQEIINQLKDKPVKPVTIEIAFPKKIHPLFEEILVKHVKMPIITQK